MEASNSRAGAIPLRRFDAGVVLLSLVLVAGVSPAWGQGAGNDLPPEPAGGIAPDVYTPTPTGHSGGAGPNEPMGSQVGGEEAGKGDETGIRTPIEYGVSQVRPYRGFRFGDLDLSFMLGQTMSVDNNIYLTDRNSSDPFNDPKASSPDDVVFVNVPGVHGDWYLGDHRLTGDYRMEITNYAEHDEQNHVNNFYDVELDLNFNEVYFNIGDRLQTLDDPLDFAPRNVVGRLNHTLNLLAGFKHQRLTMEIDYQHELFDFEGEEFEHITHDEDYISVFAAYQLNARWELTGEYRYGTVDYVQNVINDSHINEMRFGVRGFITSKLEFFGKAGWQAVTPEQGGLINDENDFSGIVASLGLRYRISPQTSITARYERNTQYGSYAAYEIGDDIELSGRHQLTKDIQVGFSTWYRQQDPSKGPQREEWGVRTGLDWQIRPWWSVSAEGLFRWQQANVDGDLFVIRPVGHPVGPVGSRGDLDYSNSQFVLSSLLAF